MLDTVVVSTDSEQYAEIVRKYGAEVPFLRMTDYGQYLLTLAKED